MARLRPELGFLPLALGAFAIAAHAQQGGDPGALASAAGVRPRLAVSQTWTDNLRLSERDKDAALITTISPGISMVRNTGSLRGSLDYSLNGITYLKTNQGSRVQNALAANVQAELVPKTLSIDVRANIGQQSATAFGLQSAPTLSSQGAVSSLDNPNTREAGTLNVSPSLRGQLGGVASLELSGNFSLTEVRGSALGDSRGTGTSLRIAQQNPGVLGWQFSASRQGVRPKEGLSNSSSTAAVGLNYRPDPELNVSANVGVERNDYLSRTGSDQRDLTGGVTASWTPTPRTRVDGNWQSHPQGSSYGLNIDHRMRNSVWRLSDSRGVVLGNAGANGGVRTNYDMYSLLLSSIEPDPVKRDVLVRTTLLTLGLSPDAQAAVGFLSTGPSQTRNQAFSFTLQGVRSSITANVNRTVTTRLGDQLNGGDLASNSRVEQRSYSLSGSYQLSGVSGVSLSVARQEALGDGGIGQRTQLTSLSANWNGRLGQRLTAQLGARHSRFEGPVPYSENAAYAHLTQQF